VRGRRPGGGGNARSGAAWPFVLLLAACATEPITVTGEAPKVVNGFDMTPYSIHEECMHLDPGDRVDYDFSANLPVDFNVHYHEGKAVLLPISRDNVYADSARFLPALAQDYCLMWTAGAGGALLDYRIAVRRTTR
jgi:hypothetical protein